MKLFIVYILLIGSIFGSDAAHSTTPHSLALNKVNAKVFPKYATSYSAGHAFVSDRFYPLGYSSNKIAYLIEHNNTPADFFSVNFIVQDLIKDKIVYNKRFKVDDPNGKYRFKDYWRLKRVMITKVLKKYAIQRKKILFYPNRLFCRGDRYSMSSKSKKVFNSDFQTRFLLSSKIYIHSKNRGTKRINSKGWKQPSYVLARKPIGFLKLGQSKRVAILVATITRGWEGPPHNLRYEVAGAHLSRGFRRGKK